MNHSFGLQRKSWTRRRRRGTGQIRRHQAQGLKGQHQPSRPATAGVTAQDWQTASRVQLWLLVELIDLAHLPVPPGAIPQRCQTRALRQHLNRLAAVVDHTRKVDMLAPMAVDRMRDSRPHRLARLASYRR